MCTSSPPTGPSAVGARHVKERQPSRETVTVVRLARHPARRHGVRCLHCRTHPSNLLGCPPSHPVRPFTARSGPLLPCACCGCTCQQPHAGPGWALTSLEHPPQHSRQPSSNPAQAQLGLGCPTLHIKSGTTNFCPVQPCNQHRRRIHMGDPWGQHRRRNITDGSHPLCHGRPPFSSPTYPRVVCCACTCAFPSS